MAGVSLNNRKLSAELRIKLLRECLAIMDGKDKKAKRALVEKMCGTLLPRLHAGRDDDDPLIPVPILGGKSKECDLQRNNSSDEAIDPQETD